MYYNVSMEQRTTNQKMSRMRLEIGIVDGGRAYGYDITIRPLREGGG